MGYNLNGTTLLSTSISPEGASFKNQNVIATGGAITTVGQWRIHRFNSSGTFTLTSFVGTTLLIDYLIVSGGGGGGMDMGGGGGGGGVLTGSATLSVSSYTITVGGGGAGAPAGCSNGQPCDHQYTIRAVVGNNTTFNSLTSYGGGYGGSSYYGYTPDYGYPGNGGSGGGPSGYSDGNVRAGGTGVSGQGYSGGGGGGQYYSGGGGGAGGTGTSSTSRANGGPGKLSSILGQPFYWGGGGAGAGYFLYGGAGGIGGGGGASPDDYTSNVAKGGRQSVEWGKPGSNGCTSCWAQVPGGDGGTNTGGGGGGGSHYNRTNQGGNGGSGIVIIRYRYI